MSFNRELFHSHLHKLQIKLRTSFRLRYLKWKNYLIIPYSIIIRVADSEKDGFNSSSDPSLKNLNSTRCNEDLHSASFNSVIFRQPNPKNFLQNK